MPHALPLWRVFALVVTVFGRPGGLRPRCCDRHDFRLFVKLIMNDLGHLDECVVWIGPPTGRARYPLGSIFIEIGNDRPAPAEPLPGGQLRGKAGVR